MNIVILHCHYERGGVTQVVENHVRSLRERADVQRIVLVSGARTSGLSASTRQEVESIVIDGFDYDSDSPIGSPVKPRAERLYQCLLERLRSEGLEPDRTVLHWHNHSLGKNTAAPAVVRLLAESGWRLLLHLHDFAEDNRPENYLRLIQAIGATSRAAVDRYLYPVASQIHYCTLTRADASVLLGLGVPSLQVTCLPNSVVIPASGTGSFTSDADRESIAHESLALVRQLFGLPPEAKWCLYPVRGIRRKNVGELLLISQLDPCQRYYGLTLCPATPVERRSYERWKQLAQGVAPSVVFDAGHHPDLPFLNNLLASDMVLSTSVAEGFGMAFLEPWLLAREVVARRLANVADDFEASGMQLTKFYDSIPIPGSSAWVARCKSQSRQSEEAAWSRLPEVFRPPLAMDGDENEWFDFAKLVPHEQAAVLERIAGDSGFRRDVLDHSALLIQHLREARDVETVALNASIVRETYSTETITEQLLSLYRKVLGSKPDRVVVSPTEAGRGLELIHRARPFFPCRTEEIPSDRS